MLGRRFELIPAPDGHRDIGPAARGHALASIVWREVGELTGLPNGAKACMVAKFNMRALASGACEWSSCVYNNLAGTAYRAFHTTFFAGAGGEIYQP